MTKSVAILALGSTYVAPEILEQYDEIWTINNGHVKYGVAPDMIIAMDDLDRDKDVEPDYVEQIVNAGAPVLSTEAKEGWPSVEPYPLREVCEFIMGFHSKPWQVLDNSCNYAFSLALARKYLKIGLFGFAWCPPYKKVDLECAIVRFAFQGYQDPPEWFPYHHPSTMIARRPLEPGVESFHFLLGVASNLRIEIHIASNSSILNQDRIPHFYGYTEQPDLLEELLNGK